MAKSIYQVVDCKTGKVEAEGFESRQEAKAIRNQMNKDKKSEPQGDAQPRFVVSRGKDHPMGATFGKQTSFTQKKGKRKR